MMLRATRKNSHRRQPAPSTPHPYFPLRAGRLIWLKGSRLAEFDNRLTNRQTSHFADLIGTRSRQASHRNGSWYDATQAQAHLRHKLEFLAANGQIRTAEEFIENIATKSALTNPPYEVRCGSGVAVSLNGWLRDELKRYRQRATAVGRSASRETRDALRHRVIQGSHGCQSSCRTLM